MTDMPGWTPPTEPDPSGPGAAPGWGTEPGQGAPPPYVGPGYAQQGWGQPGYAQPGWGQPGYNAWGHVAPQPGVIPLRPLGLGEILDGAFSVVRANPKTTLGLSAIVVVTTQALSFGVRAWQVSNRGYGDPGAFGGGFTVGAIAASIVGGIGLLVLAGMLTSVMGEAVLGHHPTIGSTWEKVRPRFWALLGAGILGTILPFLGFFACIVGAPFLWGALAFMTPVVVLERAKVFGSIRRSWRLAVPDWWRVFGIRALSAVIASVINSMLVVPAALIASHSLFTSSGPRPLGLVPLAIVTIGGAIGTTITAPFTSGVLALLYIDRRMRVEGLDVALAQTAAQQATTGTP